MMMLVALSLLAHAESPQVLPKGADVAYAGLGASSFAAIQANKGSVLNSGARDRLLALRVDTYYARGLTDRIQIAAFAPVVHSRVFDRAGVAPCPRDTEYCDAITTVGEVGLQGRWQATRGPLNAVVSLAAVADPWNRGTRGRYTAVGQGSVGLIPGVVLGTEAPIRSVTVGIVGYAHYVFRIARRVDEGPAGPLKAPGDVLYGGLEARAKVKKITTQIGLTGDNRFGGLLWDSDYASFYFPTEDRWGVLRYRRLRAEVKVSVELPQSMGLHMAVGRVVAGVNTPPDVVDVSIGVHRYFAPRP